MPSLSPDAGLRLQSLLGRTPTRRLDLDLLERSLTAIGVGEDLDSSLTSLGSPPGVSARNRRATSERREATFRAVRAEVARWIDHGVGEWADRWVDGLARSGQLAGVDDVTARAVAADVGRLIAALEPGESDARLSDSTMSPSSRVEADRPSTARNDLAARLFGSSHALDDGELLERWARRALALAFDVDPSLDGRALWAAVGVDTDLVSAPVLTWNLGLDPDTSLGAICAAATRGRVPVHLTLMALREHDVVPISVSPVLVVENPRLVEAAAQRSLTSPVIATNGNPSTAVTTLIDSLLAREVEVRVHADWDIAGIGICRRLVERGCTPWKMDADDYDAAVAAARQSPGASPSATGPGECGPTPWDPGLEARFATERIVVHEELLIDDLLGG